MPSVGQAIVELICPVEQAPAVLATSGIELQMRFPVSDDPDKVQLDVLADASGQAAAKALGCTVTIVKSAEDFADHLRSVGESLKEASKPPDPQS